MTLFVATAKKYTSDHEAVIFDDSTNIGTVTITNYAQESLGDVVFVELLKEGNELKAGDSMGAVESVKSASDLYAPVGGKIVETNGKLEETPSLINKSPESDGWIAKIQLEEGESQRDGAVGSRGKQVPVKYSLSESPS